MREWLRVYTYKAGLLSPMAHDLQLSLERWNLEREGNGWIFQASATHLRVDGSMVRGKLEPRGISHKDRKKIKGHIADTVLLTPTHPKIIFRGRLVDSELRGTLRLRGQVREISIPVKEVDRKTLGEVEIQPSLWGISPFKALGGAIRLQDRIRIQFSMEVL